MIKDGKICALTAIAESRGASLAIRNVKDFADCGIKLIDPWSSIHPLKVCYEKSSSWRFSLPNGNNKTDQLDELVAQ